MPNHEFPGVLQPLDDLDSRIQGGEELGQVAIEEPLVPRFSLEEIAKRRQRERDRIEAAKARGRRMQRGSGSHPKYY